MANLLKVVPSRPAAAMISTGSGSRRLSTTVEEKEHFYRTELVKAGVLHDQALKVAQILASRVPNEQLTVEDDQIVGQACRQWLEYRKRWHSIMHITNKMEKLYQPPGRADQGHLDNLEFPAHEPQLRGHKKAH